MKRLLCLILCTVLLAFPAFTVCAENEELTLSLSSESIAPGDTGTVTLNVTGNPGFAYLRITVSSDEKIELLTTENGDILTDMDDNYSLRSFMWSADENSKSDGVLAVFSVKVSESAVYEKDYGIDITVRECYNDKLENVSVKAAGGTVTAKKPYIKGDTDGNDGLDANDAIYLLYHIYFLDSYPVNQPCDFDGDGYETSDDAIYLLYHIYFKDSYPLH